MALVLFLPIDPWISLLTTEFSEATLAILVTILGTLQWCYIGKLIPKAYCFLKQN